MASILKFRLLSTHCGVAQSPTLSPRTSPIVHLRRRKTTLRMLLSRNTGRRSPRRRELPEKKKNERSNKLKDLFVSSPPYHAKPEEIEEKVNQRQISKNKEEESGLGPVNCQPGSPRPVWTGFRYKFLLRKTWRPVLPGIPE